MIFVRLLYLEKLHNLLQLKNNMSEGTSRSDTRLNDVLKMISPTHQEVKLIRCLFDSILNNDNAINSLKDLITLVVRMKADKDKRLVFTSAMQTVLETGSLIHHVSTQKADLVKSLDTLVSQENRLATVSASEESLRIHWEILLRWSLHTEEEGGRVVRAHDEVVEYLSNCDPKSMIKCLQQRSPKLLIKYAEFMLKH